MRGSRVLAAGLVMLVCAACSNPIAAPAHSHDSGAIRTACPTNASERSPTEDVVDAVFVQEGRLFSIQLKSGEVRELLPRTKPLNHTVHSVLFSRDGRSLLIQRDWEGRDSWWAATADGSNLRRLPLPTLEIQQAVRLCHSEFISLLKDGRFARFNLEGEPVYWQPEAQDGRRTDTRAVSSPVEDQLAYVGQSGVVILTPQEGALRVSSRVPGTIIHGWIGNDLLVTSDTTTIYSTQISTGQSRKLEYEELLGKGPQIVSVSAHPKGAALYVVNRSSIPGSAKEVVSLDPKTLDRMSKPPHQIPEGSNGAPIFSPLGTYAAWPVERPKGDPYAPNVRLVTGEGGSALLETSSGMVSVPFVFHPRDLGFVFTDLSRGGKILVYQDHGDRRTDLVVSPQGHPFSLFQWNPRLAGQ